MDHQAQGSPKVQASTHINADSLVGWSQGHLLESEREQVEAHLARCRECRDLVAALNPTVAAGGVTDTASLFGTASPTKKSTDRSWRRMLLAAGILLMAALGPRLAATSDPPAQALDLRVASAEADLWCSQRSAATGDEFYAGIKLAQAADVRLVALMADGRLLPMPLDTNGAMNLSLGADKLHSLGPYPRQVGDVALDRILVIQTQEPMPGAWLQGQDVPPIASAKQLAVFIAALAKTQQAQVDSILLSGDRD